MTIGMMPLALLLTLSGAGCAITTIPDDSSGRRRRTPIRWANGKG